MIRLSPLNGGRNLWGHLCGIAFSIRVTPRWPLIAVDVWRWHGYAPEPTLAYRAELRATHEATR